MSQKISWPILLANNSLSRIYQYLLIYCSIENSKDIIDDNAEMQRRLG